MTNDIQHCHESATRTIRHELELACTGRMYIENTSDAMRFLDHVLFLLTDGAEGEERECLRNYGLDNDEECEDRG